MKIDGKYIWMDGNILPAELAVVPFMNTALHYGLGVFEGIRFYQTEDKRPAVFRLQEHLDRLYRSAHIHQLDIPFRPEEIKQATLELIKVNRLPEGYIRPLVFLGDGAMGLLPANNPVRVTIAIWKWGAYLGEEGLKNGIRTKVSSFTRHHPNVSMTKSKCCGDYVNSILAKREVIRVGYDEAILLDPEGYVSEASGENIFIISQGVLKTAPLTSVLPGITRDSVLRIAADQKIACREERFTRDEMYCADEMFLTGTAAEITPVREVDDRKIGAGKPGPITRSLQEIFQAVVRGKDPRYRDWLTYVN